MTSRNLHAQPDAATQPDDTAAKARIARDRTEALLDQALADSFPASDPLGAIKIHSDHGPAT